MDKVFITKSELTKMIYKQKSSAGPFLTAITMFWLLFILPMLVFGVLLLIIYIPFYFIDKFILERKKNDRQQ